MSTRSVFLSACMSSAFLASRLVGCTSNVVGSVPAQEHDFPGKNAVLQFVVGTATVGISGGNCSDSHAPPYYGLNIMETFREPNGATAVLYNQPTVTGPAGFIGDTNYRPAPIAQSSSGLIPYKSNSIFGSFLGQNGLNGNIGALAQSVNPLGAFGFGFAGESLVSSAPIYEQPVLPEFDTNSITPQLCNGGNILFFYPRYIGGPPAWPTVSNGLFPNFGSAGFGFVGYNMGFFDYLSTPSSLPPTGTYTLDVAIPIGAGSNGGILTGGPASVAHVVASATLKSNAPLPLFPPPSAIRDPQHPGGLIITVAPPAGLTQAFAEVAVNTSGLNSQTITLEYYTVPLPVSQPGRNITVTLPPNLGIPKANTTTPTATVPPGASYTVYCVGFDYDDFGASYPINRSERPTLAGANGQADVTTSDLFSGS